MCCAGTGTKYTVQVHRRAADAYSLTLGSSSVDAVTRILTDGSLLVQASAPDTPLYMYKLQCLLVFAVMKQS